eukprot:scaffold3356_cov246-Alexandrium_tamarense.AAC.3
MYLAFICIDVQHDRQGQGIHHHERRVFLDASDQLTQQSTEWEYDATTLTMKLCRIRPVPPFAWHMKWAGTSWTWGPQSGGRGWAIQEMDEADSWYGRPMGDTTSVWSLRLPSGVMIQRPRVVIGGVAGLCRLAWLPEDEGEVGTVDDENKAKLPRVEASVMALEPIISDDDDDMIVGFYPPKGFVWCEVEDRADAAASVASRETAKPLEENPSSGRTSAPVDEELSKKIEADPRNALDQ